MGGPVHPAPGPGGKRVAGGGNQRVAESQVQLHRPGRGVLERPGRRAEGRLDGTPRVGPGGHVDGEADVVAEQVQLHSGLVGAGPPEFLGPVRRDDHERHRGVVCLHDRRHEVPDGGPGGGEHGRGRAGGQGQAEGGEPGGAFIDPDQQLHPSGGVGLGQGVGHRRGPGAGGHHDVAHPGVQQRGDGDAGGSDRGQPGRRAHMFSGVSMPSSSRPPESRRSTSEHRASRDSRTDSSAFSTGHWS